MRILVTGGSGNIGKEVVLMLHEQGHGVLVYDKAPYEGTAPVEAQLGDIAERERLAALTAEGGFGAVIHLASMLQFGCEVEPAEAIEVNVTGTVNVLEAARKAGISRVVLAGTLATFGSTAEYLSEESPIQADAPLYGLTKLIGESVARRYNVLFGMNCLCLRFGAVLSGRPVSSPGVAAALATLCSAATGKDVKVKGVSQNDQRHFVYFKDAARAAAMAAVAEKPEHMLFNIAGGEDCVATFGGLAEIVRKHAPGAGKIEFEGRSGDRGVLDTSRAERELGYKPAYTMDSAIAEIVARLKST